MKTKILSYFVFAISFTLYHTKASAAEKPIKPFVVVLDAGHGGKDPGNRGNGYIEKNIALEVVLKVGKLLEKDPNIKVIYTRKTDVFIELRERAAIANRADADLFVSVHCNSHTSQAYGAETYVMGLSKTNQNLNIAKKENEVIYLEDNYKEKYAGFDPNSPESLIGITLMQEEYLDQSIMLASLIQGNMVNRLKRNDRKVKQDVFWVLHNTYMPSVLVEIGFLTNNSEGAYLNSEKGKTDMAGAIADGILTYKDNLQMATEDSKSPKITDQEIDKAIETTEKKVYDDVIFKVQIAASGKKLDPKPRNFKGLKDVSRDKEDGLYKYYYGETSDYNKIQLMRTIAQQKGYATAYIVAFKKGKKLNISEVLKSTDN